MTQVCTNGTTTEPALGGKVTRTVKRPFDFAGREPPLKVTTFDATVAVQPALGIAATFATDGGKRNATRTVGEIPHPCGTTKLTFVVDPATTEDGVGSTWPTAGAASPRTATTASARARRIGRMCERPEGDPCIGNNISLPPVFVSLYDVVMRSLEVPVSVATFRRASHSTSQDGAFPNRWRGMDISCHRQRQSWYRRLAFCAAVVATVGMGASVASAATTAPPAPVATHLATHKPVVPPLTIVAAAKNAKTPAFATERDTKPVFTFDNRKNFSGRHVFVVLETRGPMLLVKLPMRPNGRTGFVRASDVTLYQHDYAITVDLSDRTLVLYRAGKEIRRDTVAIGQSKYPTPIGAFFTRELAKPSNPKGSYGVYAIGLSGYSNVLTKFGSGDGQVGIHGTNEPGKLGQAVSHGCVRMTNAAITALAKTLPQGVPVEVLA